MKKQIKRESWFNEVWYKVTFVKDEFSQEVYVSCAPSASYNRVVDKAFREMKRNFRPAAFSYILDDYQFKSICVV